MQNRTWIWAAVVLVVAALLWMGGVFGGAPAPVPVPAAVAPAAGTPPAASPAPAATPAPEVRSGG